MGAGPFDNVRIVDSPETRRLGYAGRVGECCGFTTPSVTGVEVIGFTGEDYALNVYFEDCEEDAWFAADLVELVDHAPGTEIRIGDYSAVRLEDGTWKETSAGSSGERPEGTSR